MSDTLRVQKRPLVDLTFGLEIGPEFEIWFVKLGGVFFLFVVESDATLEPRPNIYILDVNFSVNSLGPTFCPQLLELFGFGVSLVFRVGPNYKLTLVVKPV